MLALLSLWTAQNLYSQYCWPDVQMACFYGDKITNVTFAGINHTDAVCGDDQDGKKDFTSTVAPAQVTAGQSYQISVTAENSLSSGTERIRIWIDFNQNQVFEATESFDLGTGTGNTTLTASIPVPSTAVSGTTRMRVMYRRTNALNAADACHSYGNYRGQAKDYAVTVNSTSACTGALTPGNTISTLSSACPGEPFTLSLQNTVSGTTFQWQSSANGTAWSNIAGANAATLTTSHNTATYYRCVVTCAGNTGNSNPVQVSSGGPVYTTLPVNESFENWSSMCGQATNVPGIAWLTTPATGEHSWRREDQGASASWGAVSTGAYAPVFSHGSHSARFHSSGAAASVSGTMDLYVDCSAGNPQKQLTFDYINTSGTDKLQIWLSMDGGTTFSQVGTDLLTTTGWTAKNVSFTTSSATAIVRLKAIADQQATDIGVDNLVLQAVQACNAPTGLAVSSLTTSSAVIGWTAASPVPVSGYEYVISTSNATPSGNGTAWSVTSYNASSLAANTTYYFFVRSACGASSFSNWVSIDFTTTVTPCAAPVSPIVSAIAAQSATLSWTAPATAPAGGYEYVVSTANNTPTGSGTPVTGTSVPLISLTPNTGYYIFIRSKCSNGNYSSWIMINFTTKSTAGIGEQSQQALKVFPNPATDEISIETESVIGRIVVTDLAGKIMIDRASGQSAEKIFIGGLSAGTYLLQVHSDRGVQVRQLQVINAQ